VIFWCWYFKANTHELESWTKRWVDAPTPAKDRIGNNWNSIANLGPTSPALRRSWQPLTGRRLGVDEQSR
jgi:hypothetical protein